MKVLLVEDHEGVGSLVRDLLQDEGFQVEWARDGEEALHLERTYAFDVAVLDLMLPRHSGFDILQTWRAQGRRLPVLILTARSALPDRVQGLNSGADDYLTKPFAGEELVARLRALWRRVHDQPSNTLTVGRLTLDLAGGPPLWEGQPVNLHRRERDVLEFLALNAGGYFTRESIFARVWPNDSLSDARTVDTHVRLLRQKLSGDAIETRRGQGYCFVG
ncbi:transcriptional regulatory protein QseB [Deinococcus carri]|uniref:Transcriptional regulatory protein QseB n=1 Tax=Deinococcus carri TaxID=1211323 RepID=A0ABP9W609_9DEIO